MNRRDIEEAQRISKEFQDSRRFNEEIRNARRIQNELTDKNNLSGLGIEKELQNRRDEIRRIKDFQTPHNRLELNNSSIFKNELLDSRRSLQRILDTKDLIFDKSLVEARKNFLDRNNFETQYIRQNQREIEQIRRDYLRNEKEIDLIRKDYLKSVNEINLLRRDYLRNENEILRIRKDYLNTLPEWEKQILPALAIRRSEVEEILNNRTAIREKLELIPSNFQRQEFWNEIENLRDTYVGNLAISMREAVETSSSNEEALGKIESLFEDKVALLPQNQISREFVISLFLTVLFTIIQLWYSHYLSEQSSVEVKTLFTDAFSRLEKIESKLGNFENSGLDDEILEDNEVYYLVERTVSVYNRPNFKSLTVDYLSPKTKVRLLKTKHKWIYIEYIDYLEVVPRYGWVNKKYLRRLNQ